VHLRSVAKKTLDKNRRAHNKRE